MRTLIFANRITKEILRDPLSLFFGIAFPVILLFLLSAINKSIPVDLFSITSLAPGIAVFSLSFMALFAAQVLSKDRASSFLARLYTTPMTSQNFIIGYILPLLAMSAMQVVVCIIVSVVLGLKLTASLLLLVILLIPMALIYISFGLICGTLFSEKAAAAICGAFLTNVSAWLSGAWFDLDLIGGLFKEIAYLLPFVHAVEMGRGLLSGDLGGIFPHIWWVIAYALLLVIASVLIFKAKAQER